MPLPRILTKRTQEALRELEEGASGELNPLTRLNLYKAFGDSVDLSGQLYKQFREATQLKLPNNYKKFVNLAILTSQHILPIWNKYEAEWLADDEMFPIEFPGTLLKVARDFLLQEISFKDAFDLYNNEYYHQLGAIAYDVKYDAYLVAVTAYRTLGIALGLESLQLIKLIGKTSNDSLDFSREDFAFSAMKAYSALDENKPGDWMFPKRKPYPVMYDHPKKLEFWRWWLTDAIPQAWETTRSN